MEKRKREIKKYRNKYYVTMIITHCISTIDKSAGGPSRSVPNMCNCIACKEYKINLLYYDSPEPNIGLIDNPFVSCLPTQQEGILESKKYIDALANRDCDIIQTHNLWTPILHHVAIYARRNNIPYIVTPRGTLDPWPMHGQGYLKYLKKKFALWLYQKKDLDKASCIQVTSMAEADAIRAMKISTPLALIPNNVDLSHYPIKEDFSHSFKRVLFLSRIHPKKGIEPLIMAWSMIPAHIKEGWSLDIVGNHEDENYKNQLENLIASRGVSSEVHILPPLFGLNKIQKYHESDIFILPTEDENFGMVIAEALACGVPVITTKGAPWKDLTTYNCGWWIDDNSVECISKHLQIAMTTTPNDLISMGKNGRRLIENKYSSAIITEQLRSLYQWIHTGHNKPNFILEK